MKWKDKMLDSTVIAAAGSQTVKGDYPVLHAINIRGILANCNTLANLALYNVTVKIGARVLYDGPLHVMHRHMHAQGGNPGGTGNTNVRLFFGSIPNAKAVSVLLKNNSAIAPAFQIIAEIGDEVDSPAYCYEYRAGGNDTLEAVDFIQGYVAGMDTHAGNLTLTGSFGTMLINLSDANNFCNEICQMETVNGTYAGYTSLDGIFYAGNPMTISFVTKLGGGATPDLLFRRCALPDGGPTNSMNEQARSATRVAY